MFLGSTTGITTTTTWITTTTPPMTTTTTIFLGCDSIEMNLVKSYFWVKWLPLKLIFPFNGPCKRVIIHIFNNQKESEWGLQGNWIWIYAKPCNFVKNNLYIHDLNQNFLWLLCFGAFDHPPSFSVLNCCWSAPKCCRSAIYIVTKS